MSDIVTDYSLNPVNNFEMQDADFVYEEWNIVCWDQITIFVKFEDDKKTIKEFSFTWNTSTVSTATASIIAEDIPWKTTDEVMQRNYEYLQWLWVEVTARRKRAAVLPIVALINWIYKYKEQEIKVDFDDLIE